MAAVGPVNPVPRWQRVALDAALIGLLASGLIWLPMHYVFGAGAAEGGLPHGSEAWLMRAHGLAGFVALLAIGAFLGQHAPRGWRARRGRALACTMLACLGIAVGTAYCLYYFAPEPARAALGWLHAAAGGAWGVTVAWHRRKRRDAA